MKIMLDAGHGGTNPGAIGPGGLEEAYVNLDVVLRLGRILTNRGFEVNYTRVEDVNVSLAERAALANEWGADYFVSVHCNSNVNPDIKGTATYYYKDGTVAQALAQVVNDALSEQIGTRNIGIFQANFAVLRRTRMPAILVELAFISNPEEEALLSMDTFRENCAIGIANGLNAYIYG